ncbi:hypothetical protein [Marinoscillum sp.]|uniref:hypothetical protein n=1 Tax=Marinoscillum sp. TaxID=2024838 RepID=UPI003BA8F804
MRHITEEEIIEYLETGELEQELSHHLNTCEDCSSELEQYQQVIKTMDQMEEVPVPDAVQFQVSTAIAEEVAKENRSGSFAWWQVAAAVALLVLGFSIGKFSADDQSEELVALKAQLEILKEVSMVNALNPASASERLQVVNRIESEKPVYSEKLLSSLFKTLNTDESPNVRYAAAQALVRFMDQETVRTRMAESLEIQTDPLIQISLISILAEAQEKQAVKPLRHLLDQESTNPEVKKQAKIALDILI